MSSDKMPREVAAAGQRVESLIQNGRFRLATREEIREAGRRAAEHIKSTLGGSVPRKST